MKTAKYIKSIKWAGYSVLYELSERVSYVDKETDMIIVSSVDGMFGAETFVFPADKEGNSLEGSELKGSFKGTSGSHKDDHIKALKIMGYEIAW